MYSTNKKKSIALPKMAMIIAVIILTSYTTISFLLSYDISLRTTVSDLFIPLISLAVVISLFYAAKQSRIFGPRVQIAWTLLAFAQLSFTIGEIIWAILEVGLGQSPFPSYADIFYTIYYPIFAIGILFLPRTSFNTNIYRKTIDLAIVMISAALIFWIFLIIPTIETVRGNSLEAILSLNYIVADFVLLFVLLDMLFNKIKSFTDTSLIFLAAGIMALISTDTIFAYQSLQNTYVSGGFTDIGWILSYLLIGLGAVCQINASKSKYFDKSTESWFIKDKFPWISYIPLIWVLVAYILLLWSYYQNYVSELIVLELGVGAIIVLVIIRQILSMRENRQLYLEAQKEIELRKKTEKELKKALNEKEILVKEIHHRVKNNLAVISSLLNLQSRYIKDTEALDIFKESQNRAKSMALIHEYLYQSDDLKRINFGEYINKLSTNLFHTYVVDSSLIKLNVDTENIMLDVNIAIPLGLVLNELVTNTMKHAFPDNKKGKMNIKFYSKGDEFILTISDNGIGLPEGLDYKNTDSLGLRLVNSLTDQINGSISLNRNKGTTFKIKFTESLFKS